MFCVERSWKHATCTTNSFFKKTILKHVNILVNVENRSNRDYVLTGKCNIFSKCRVNIHFHINNVMIGYYRKAMIILFI